MIYVVFLAIPVALGAACLLGGATPGLVFVVSVSWALSAVGLWFRRFAPITVAALLLLLSYLGRGFSGEDPLRLWGAAGFGVGLFAMLEIGHDCTTIAHGKLTVASYRLRTRYIASIAVLDLAGVFVVATLAYNVALRFPGLPFSVMVLPVLFVVIGGAGYLAYRRVRDARGPEDESRR